MTHNNGQENTNMKVFNNLRSRNLPKDQEYLLDTALGDLLEYRKSRIGTETYWRNHPEVRAESGLLKEILKDDIIPFWYLYELCCMRENSIARSLAEDAYYCDKKNHVPLHEARETYEAILEWNDYVDLNSLREELCVSKDLIDYYILIDEDTILNAIAIGDRDRIQSLLATSRRIKITSHYKDEMEHLLSSALEPQNQSSSIMYDNPLFSSPQAQELISRLVHGGFFDSIRVRRVGSCTIYQQVYAAHCISTILWKKNHWKPFEDLWGIKNMRVTFKTMQERPKEVSQDSIDDIEDLFPEYKRRSIPVN